MRYLTQKGARRMATRFCRAMRLPAVTLYGEAKNEQSYSGLYTEETRSIVLVIEPKRGADSDTFYHELAHHMQHFFLSDTARDSGSTVKEQHDMFFMVCLVAVLNFFRVPLTSYKWDKDWDIVGKQAKVLLK